jgi:hypothetical protein
LELKRDLCLFAVRSNEPTFQERKSTRRVDAERAESDLDPEIDLRSLRALRLIAGAPPGSGPEPDGERVEGLAEGVLRSEICNQKSAIWNLTISR